MSHPITRNHSFSPCSVLTVIQKIVLSKSQNLGIYILIYMFPFFKEESIFLYLSFVPIQKSLNWRFIMTSYNLKLFKTTRNRDSLYYTETTHVCLRNTVPNHALTVEVIRIGVPFLLLMYQINFCFSGFWKT